MAAVYIILEVILVVNDRPNRKLCLRKGPQGLKNTIEKAIMLTEGVS